MLKITSRAVSLVLALAIALSVAAVSPLTANAAAEPPVWKVLWLCYGSLNATVTRGGSSRNYAITLSEADKEIVASMPAKFKAYIERSADNNVSVSVDYVCPENPITSVSRVSPGDDSSFWVSPADVKADLDKYAPPGMYDSIIVASRMDGIPRSYWGLAQGATEMSNSAGYSFVAFLDGDMSWYMATTADNPYPEEVFVHEWLHQLEAFYRGKGYTFPGVDDSIIYGYKNALTIGYNGWHVYYGDIMKCTVYDSNLDKYIGMTAEMWRIKPSEEPVAKATIEEALPTVENGIPEGAVIYESHSYKIFAAGVDWKSAKEFCEQTGGHLVTITSAGEQEFVEKMKKPSDKKWFWIGATCEDKPGTWTWVTGEKWSYSNWDAGEPNYSNGTELYAATDMRRGYRWNDIMNSGGYSEGDWLVYGGFICEWDTAKVEEIPTVDVSTASSWAKESITTADKLKLVTSELTNGYQVATTRAEFCRAAVNFLRAYGYDVDNVTQKTFADTSDRDIGVAAALGITSGTDTGKNLFSPDSTLTREQAATMLRNVMNVIGKPAPASGVAWTDAKDISSWAKEASDIMYSAKIMGGTSTTELVFSPKTPYTHEQSIITLVNLWEHVKK
ncbi:hypothetical protein FACS1894202_01270 [Clostridia bacterium]|nr:hypothetical protein FACS1894202_01270 [Clostridia bacterium]